jgi:predicted molibdopterin-dependent oxidoreductase YjgC
MKVTIDGRTFEAPEKATILDVARANGVYIPTLCDHKRLLPFTACRICLVEIKGRRGAVPACGTHVEDGMVVTSESPGLLNLRRTVLELILSEHPHACLICSERTACPERKTTIRKVGEVTGCVLCPNTGRCELQEVVEYLKIERVKFPALFRNLEVRKDDPLIDRDYNLCILCGRCVRICHEVRGASVLAFTKRGPETVIGTALGKRMLETRCEFCGACVDVCPTGALFERAARYGLPAEGKKRVVCALCSQGCGLDAEIAGGRIQSAAPAEDAAVNRGQACVKGRFLLAETIHHPRRLLKPLVRANGRLEETSWADALAVAAAKLKACEPGEAAVWTSDQDTCEDIFALRKFARDGLRTGRVAGRESGSAADKLRDFGRRRGFEPALDFSMENLGKGRAFLVFGEDLPATHPIVWVELHAALRHGAKVIAISPREFAFKRCASGWIKIGPEKEALLVNTLARLLLTGENGQKTAVPVGFEAYKSRLRKIDVAAAAAELGVAEEKLFRLAALIEKKRPAAILFGSASVTGPEGEANLEAFWNFSVLTNGVCVPLAGAANERGATAVGDAFGAVPKGNGAAAEIRVLLSSGPVPDWGGKKPGFVIAQDAFSGPHLDAADVVFPQATFVESGGTFVNVEGRIQSFAAALSPRGESRPGWMIVRDLAKAMGLDGFDFADGPAILASLAEAAPDFRAEAAGAEANPVFVGSGNGKVRVFAGPAAPAAQNRLADVAPPAGPADVYKGLNLAEEIKALRTIRNRGK